ncbi:MAG: cyclic nucleotide-binding domain-containing protein [Bdellovibrionales bacterium]|nr:cyclic nucleotide-binding domain-containing protein [Bdellovibrionales bacterium]
MEITLEKKLELINKISFFTRFDDADKITMAEMASFEKYRPGDKLIEQSSINSQLFFIINGNVDIVIDEKLVLTLSGGGHVFGEMSFVHDSPASASVVANTKVVAMTFDTMKINLMVEPIYYKFRMNIYRSCADILAKRLIHTNSIATTFIHNNEKIELDIEE